MFFFFCFLSFFGDSKWHLWLNVRLAGVWSAGHVLAGVSLLYCCRKFFGRLWAGLVARYGSTVDNINELNVFFTRFFGHFSISILFIIGIIWIRCDYCLLYAKENYELSGFHTFHKTSSIVFIIFFYSIVFCCLILSTQMSWNNLKGVRTFAETHSLCVLLGFCSQGDTNERLPVFQESKNLRWQFCGIPNLYSINFRSREWPDDDIYRYQMIQTHWTQYAVVSSFAEANYSEQFI